jgi:hypothetical protein
LKKGDLGGFENLQGEGIYGKRYTLPFNRKPKTVLTGQALAKADGLGGDFHQLVVVDELHGLL